MIPEHRRRRHLAAAFFLVASAAGCNSDPEPVESLPRVAVEGKVPFDGSPLPAGRIQFQPVGTEPAAIAVGEIQDG